MLNQMCDCNELKKMDETNSQLSEYFVQNYNLHVLSYSEEEPQNVLSLNLTNTGITSLDNESLRLIPNLQSIDLSYNLLKDLSNLANIDLPRLNKLDLKYNQISDFSFLSNFKSLQELDIRGNNLEPTLPYWVVCELPKLKLFNCEDISEIRKYVTLAELQVMSSIDTIFNNEFEVSLKNTESGILQMKTQLTNSLMEKCGAIEETQTLAAQTALKYKVEQFVYNKLNDVIKNILVMKKNQCLSNNIIIRPNDSQFRVYGHQKSVEVMPQKIEFNDIESDLLATAISEAIGEINVEIKPSIDEIKMKSYEKVSDDSSNERPKSGQSLNLSKNALKRRQPLKESDPRAQTRNSSFPLSYELIKILRKHSRKTEANDSKTSIWDIKYKPIGRSYCGNHLVVTCGANILNLIDLKTGSVFKRYEDKQSNETYNCIVWSDFIVNTANGMTRDLSLLCVGGTKKDNKLTNILFLNAEDMSDFFKIRSHSQSVNCLLFHPTKKNLLFSGSYDRKVMLWKLDSGKMTHLSKLSSLTVCKLREIDCNNRILSLVFAKTLNILVVSGEDGIVLIKPSNESADKKGNSTPLTYRVDIPEKKKVIDGLVMVGSDSSLIAFRLKELIFVADLKKMIESTDDKRVVPLVVISRLRYCPHKCDYFYMTIESRLLCCGSAEGQILIYYLKDSILKSYQKENLLDPIRVLPKPELNNFGVKDGTLLNSSKNAMFMNMAAVSPNHEYIVGGTNNNLICIWKRSHSLPQNSSKSSYSLGTKKLKTVASI